MKRQDYKKRVLPVLPLRDTVVFPFMTANLNVGRASSIRLVEEVKDSDSEFCVVKQKNDAVNHPDLKDLYQIGTICRIQKVVKHPDKTMNLMVQGLFRVKIVRLEARTPYLRGELTPIRERVEMGEKTEALKRTVLNSFVRLLSLSPYLSEELHTIVLNIDHPGKFADFIAANLIIPLQEKQNLLGIHSAYKRLEHLVGILTRELDLLELGSKIENKVRGELDRSQREYVLREQMDAIRKELGEDDSVDTDIAQLEKKLRGIRFPPAVRREVRREVDRLRRMSFASPEYTISRTYLDWILDLPWGVVSRENLNIAQARAVLDRDHYNLAKVKERILEFLAVRKLRGKSTGSILCFVGPPGVGKTSLGRSIAQALGRQFVRVSLGGVRDEAEIRGHRRTYIGALPGKIIQGMKRAKFCNPVFMLDEIDKLGADFRGDPASALLEVLDPEQNASFEDHFLDMPYDLSRVMFIATANVVDSVLPALRDRLEVIEIPGYTVEDKMEIARRYLLPKVQDMTGVRSGQAVFAPEALERIIVDYTREAGVRNLERELQTVHRKVARKLTQTPRGDQDTFAIGAAQVPEYLGPARFFFEAAERLSEPGISIGLAWTEVGGEIMFIEAGRMRGEQRLILTGQLGEVMRESAQAALSCIKSNARALGIDERELAGIDIHLHVPAGAIPKDGPSAGVAMYVALVSLFTHRLVCSSTAITGEITLRGKVLPVGGIKEKVLAASRAGLTRVVLPAENKKDLEDIPAAVQQRLQFLFVSRMEEVLEYVLKPEAAGAAQGPAGPAGSTPAHAPACGMSPRQTEGERF